LFFQNFGIILVVDIIFKFLHTFGFVKMSRVFYAVFAAGNVFVQRLETDQTQETTLQIEFATFIYPPFA